MHHFCGDTHHETPVILYALIGAAALALLLLVSSIFIMMCTPRKRIATPTIQVDNKTFDPERDVT